MPLHLLGKKSWNVYNQANIDRVRRDEADAKAREEEDERRMQEADAERRIQLLRGGRVAPASNAQGSGTTGRDRKRRRLAGEDDTQREIRLANASAMTLQDLESQTAAKKSSDAPLIGKDGHISLFPQEGPLSQVQKNPEAEAEAAKKKREYEDQFTMRFSNAAGFKQGIEKPWYSLPLSKPEDTADPVGKDVWGNDDKGRKDRDKRRMADEDPLVAIKKGMAELREVENDRRKWKEEREKEFMETSRETSRRRRRDSYESEAFSPDPQRNSNPAKITNKGGTTSTSGRPHRHNNHNNNNNRSRSRSRERPRNHHNSHSHRHRDHRSRHHSHSSRHKRDPSPADDSLARLRQERDEREKKERLKATALVAKVREGDEPAWVKGPGRYSKQFADQQ